MGRPAALLGRHLARLKESAHRLGLALEPDALPGPSDIEQLISQEGVRGDCLVRITLSGGLDRETPGTLWMRTRPLPPTLSGPGARVRCSWQIAADDSLGASKTLNYWRRREVFERAKGPVSTRIWALRATAGSSKGPGPMSLRSLREHCSLRNPIRGRPRPPAPCCPES